MTVCNLQLSEPAGGTYTLTILDTLSNCQETVDVIIPEDTTLPIVEAGDTTEITCLVNVVTLDGTNSDSGANIEYLWTTVTTFQTIWIREAFELK